MLARSWAITRLNRPKTYTLSLLSLSSDALPLRPSSLGSSVVPYKSGERQKLVDAGHLIVGNMGDQWSDLLGTPEAYRTFKVPDPMYYVA
nr:unnamed protein product [Digitaria exilis]